MKGGTTNLLHTPPCHLVIGVSVAGPNIKQLRKKLQRQINGVSDKEFADQSSFTRHYGRKLRMPKYETQILEAFESLEREGVIVLKRKGSQVFGFNSPVPDDAKLGMLASSPTARRNAMFAKDTPFYLPDDLCSPVVTSYLPGRSPEQAVVPLDLPVVIPATKESNESEKMNSSIQKMTVAELNQARAILQELAVADCGILEGVSCTDFIQDGLKCNNKRAESLNILLAKVSPPVRVSRHIGNGKWIHTIDLNRTEISEDEMKAARRAKKPAGQPTAPTVNPPVEEEPVLELQVNDLSEETVDNAELHASVAADPEKLVPEDVVTRLLKVVELLENENLQLKADVAEYSQQARDLLKLYNESNDLLAEAQGKVAALSAQVLSHSAQVADVLGRYNV